VKIKTWRNALGNTITKMPSEGIDVVSWFVSIDKLFEQLSVPADLQAILIRPYLLHRAKLLISKCDYTHSAKNENIKSFLLKELHLSPAVCLKKFNSLTKDKNKTYTQFSTRLMSLFDYYLESRKIGQSYEKLTDLMVYDRVISCLNPALSRYVLSREADHKEGWIGRQGLAEALDSYLANLPEGSGRSRFIPVPQTRAGIKLGNGKRETQPERFSGRSGSLYTDSQSQRPVPAPRPVLRRCYLCNSRAHLAPECPQRSSPRGFTPKPVPRPQVNFCRTKQKADQPKHSNDGARVTRDRSAGAVTCSNCNSVSGASLQHDYECILQLMK